MSKISVEGVEDRLAFPLTTHQVQQIRSVAEKAPFGKGTETVVDESVRKAWQIHGDKVEFSEFDEWNDCLSSIVVDLSTQLGVRESQRHEVKASLYKMLL